MHEQILGFEARLLMRLPEPPTLLVDLADTGETVRIAPAQAAVGDEATRVDSTRPDPTRLDPTRLDPVCFDEDEWAALVTAVEADRVWPDDFRMICERKRSELEYRLTPARALGGAQPDPAERWSVAEVIGRLGARLRAVVDR